MRHHEKNGVYYVDIVDVLNNLYMARLDWNELNALIVELEHVLEQYEAKKE